MKFYWVTMNGITLQVDAQGLEGWINYILDLGKVPTIEKVQEVI